MSSSSPSSGRDSDAAAQGHKIEGEVPSSWYVELKVENQRLRAALSEIAERDWRDEGGRIAAALARDGLNIEVAS